jgi:hypothetical protein
VNSSGRQPIRFTVQRELPDFGVVRTRGEPYIGRTTQHATARLNPGLLEPAWQRHGHGTEGRTPSWNLTSETTSTAATPINPDIFNVRARAISYVPQEVVAARAD